MDAIRDGLYEILASDHPQTVRGVFYQATVRGLVPKTDKHAGYPTVQRLLVEMRREGLIPYGWISDATRWMRKPQTWSSTEAALRRTAETYRRSLWDEGDVRVEIWLEKEALAGVLVDVTDEWDVPLMVTRGFPSLSYLHAAAEAIVGADDTYTYIYYFGDRDPSGVAIDAAIKTGIGQSIAAIVEVNWEPEYAFNVYARFERVAVTSEQIEEWDLPTRPTKTSDSRSKNFKGDSVELDAIPAWRLREIASACIERHVDHHQLEILRKTEADERRILERMVEGLR